MLKQKTLKDSFSLSGKGLHTGLDLTVTFNPAPDNHGYKIQRIDLEGQPTIDAVADNVTETTRGTVLSKNGVKVSTVEHGMAALYALGIDNCLIQVNGPEFPILDGSAQYYVQEIERVGTEEQSAVKDFYIIKSKIEFRDEATGSSIIVLPDENFSLNVKANTIHAIIGPNGSGKTTLLRLITGVYQPNAGTINIAGKYAMELENDYLYEEQTGLENLRIFGKYFGFEINDRSDGYCTQLGLTEHLGKRVSTYSKGMKRKLSLLIVIMMGRDILLMDEPTSGVDPISRVEIRSLIEALKADGKTVIITSHDLSEIEKCADDVSMIKNGRLLFDKGIQEMQGQSLEEIFIKEGNRHE